MAGRSAHSLYLNAENLAEAPLTGRVAASPAVQRQSATISMRAQGDRMRRRMFIQTTTAAVLDFTLLPGEPAHGSDGHNQRSAGKFVRKRLLSS